MQGSCLVSALTALYREDQKADRTAEEYRAVRADRLAKQLDLDDQSLRQLVSRTRKSLAQKFSDRCDRILGQDDIIQNVPAKGYRLNPALVMRPLALLDPKPH